MQMSCGKKATTGTAIGGGLNSNSGGELQLYLDWKRNIDMYLFHKALHDLSDKATHNHVYNISLRIMTGHKLDQA